MAATSAQLNWCSAAAAGASAATACTILIGAFKICSRYLDEDAMTMTTITNAENRKEALRFAIAIFVNFGFLSVRAPSTSS